MYTALTNAEALDTSVSLGAKHIFPGCATNGFTRPRMIFFWSGGRVK